MHRGCCGARGRNHSSSHVLAMHRGRRGTGGRNHSVGGHGCGTWHHSASLLQRQTFNVRTEK
eukprot:scaffold285_cov330-Pavlova_lutheri.AAC.66